TTLDKNFLGRALCLYQSWAEHVPNGEFGFYCMDDAAVRVLRTMALPRAIVVAHEEFADAALSAVRQTRTMPEYCWTAKPAILLHALRQRPGLEWVVYLDSDMMFFGDANQVLTYGDYRITPHRFHPDFASYLPSIGIYNAGYIAFRNSPRGCEALQWWLQRCLEWCGAVPVPGKYADQKYLDELPALFGDAPQDHIGLNAAPWNIDNYRVAANSGRVELNGEPLLLFHFQGFKIHGRRLHDMYSGDRKLATAVAEHVYVPYARRLATSIARTWDAGADHAWGIDSVTAKPRLIYRHLRKMLRGRSNLTLAAG
ncbi:MAG TPA: hypothetical protein VJS66_05775, partial [Burkholderiales bacterium]|nr:hypothetical protein [Burkholderiales bacterium]